MFRLSITNAHLDGCTFKNIYELDLEDCTVVNCTFNNVSSITSSSTDFRNSLFKDCCSYGDFLKVENGEVKGCHFDTVTVLGEDSCLIRSAFDNEADIRQITECRFTDCVTEGTSELCRCFLLTPQAITSSVEIDNYNYNTNEVTL